MQHNSTDRMPKPNAKILTDVTDLVIFCSRRHEAVDIGNMLLQGHIAEFHVYGIDWLILNPTMAINFNQVSVLFWAKFDDSSDFVFYVFRCERGEGWNQLSSNHLSEILVESSILNE